MAWAMMADGVAGGGFVLAGVIGGESANGSGTIWTLTPAFCRKVNLACSNCSAGTSLTAQMPDLMVSHLTSIRTAEAGVLFHGDFVGEEENFSDGVPLHREEDFPRSIVGTEEKG